MEKHEHIHDNKRPNSYEFGKAGNRVKIYFDTLEELKAQVEAYKLAGFGVEEL